MKSVTIHLLSNSMGDTIAIVPYVLEYKRKHNVDVFFKINKSFINILEPSYPEINFIGKDSNIETNETITLDYIFFKNIQQGYAEQLGFENPIYIRPIIKHRESIRQIKNKYAALGIHSTAQLKYWNHPDGKQVQEFSPYWNELSSLLRKEGITPVTVEKDSLFGVPPFFNGVPSKSNKKIGQSLLESMDIISNCEFYIGLSSGISWLAHAMGKKVVMISNFTEDWNEFDINTDDYIRITNKSVCHGCWNLINKEYTFDAQDWYWCPKHRNTEREFECHKSITPEMVMEQIKPFL